MTILLRDILGSKGRAVVTVSVHTRLSEVVQTLVKHNIGSLVICDGERMVGIVTERDILRTVAEVGVGLENIPVAQRMTSDVISGAPDDNVDKIMGLMTERRIRHMPVLDQGRLAGMVSIGDLVKAQHDRVTMEHQQLMNYIQS